MTPRERAEAVVLGLVQTCGVLCRGQLTDAIERTITDAVADWGDQWAREFVQRGHETATLERRVAALAALPIALARAFQDHAPCGCDLCTWVQETPGVLQALAAVEL